MIERRCDSWEQFQRHLDAFFKKSPWERDRYIFRGQADARWQLTSTLDRFISQTSESGRASLFFVRDSVESQLLANFNKSARGLDASVHVLHEDSLRLLARHHGLPSSIMDWTRSPYVAAYFALSDTVLSRPQPPSEVAIWVLDREDVAADSRIEVLAEHQAVVVIPRAIEQQSTFVRVVMGEVNIEQAFPDALRKFVLPASVREEAIARLASMRIDASMLFRSLDAAAETAAVTVRTLLARGPND